MYNSSNTSGTVQIGLGRLGSVGQSVSQSVSDVRLVWGEMRGWVRL